MLTLILALTVSQAPLAQDFTPPPMTSADVMLTRSARLVTQPRVEGGAMVGRIAMATVFGFLGSALGAGLTGGAGLLAAAGGGSAGVAFAVGAAVLVAPIGVGLGILGVAIGSAFFGTDFGKDFREALTVAGLTVPIATALVFGLLLLSVSPLLAIAVPFLAAAIATPLIVQARKPMERAQPVRAPEPVAGVTVFQL